MSEENRRLSSDLHRMFDHMAWADRALVDLLSGGRLNFGAGSLQYERVVLSA